MIYIALGVNINIYSQSQNNSNKKIISALEIIRFAYVEDVEQDKLVEKAIIAMLKELDPHSVYISKKEIEKANEPLIGNFEGVGIQFQIYKDTIMVIAPVPGGPSDKLGIIAGDKIITIDGKGATGEEIDNKFVIDHLRGEKGSKVDVGIVRKGKSEILEFTIIRDKIPINSLDAAFMVDDKVGYIKINHFAKTTMNEFHKALKNLQSEGMEHLILDLRNNTGGYLETSINLSDEFIDNKKLIVYTEGKASPRADYYATNKGGFEKGRLVVLINEGSASASEIVSGAVQDLDRGLIIGRLSFGKGLVQKPYELPDGSVIRLTTARYHTPTGRCIQRPYDEGKSEYYKNIANRLIKGELSHADSIHFPDSLKYFTKNKRIVYGGGGIMPDIFVPVDTSDISDYYIGLFRKNIMNEFIISYLEKNRSLMSAKYADFDNFKAHFIINEEIFNELIEYAENNDLERNDEEIEMSKKYILNVIKALLARNLFNINAYYEINSQLDDGFLKAVELINDKKTFKKMKIDCK